MSTDTAASCPHIPYVKGKFRLVLEPPGKMPDQRWYINDHCFLVTATNEIHWFGITNPVPADKRNYYGPGSHRYIGHASSQTPWGEWISHPHVYALSEGSTDHIGACFAVEDPARERFLMIHRMKHQDNSVYYFLMESKDLFNWNRINAEPFHMGDGTRDPCLLKRGTADNPEYVLYSTASFHGQSAIVFARSSDLVRWEFGGPALLENRASVNGHLESPFVMFYKGWYYLFVCNSHHQYEETIVFASRSPYEFQWEQPLCTLFAHAAEIVQWGGNTYISHCGLEDMRWKNKAGLYMAELGWAHQGVCTRDSLN